MRNDLLQNYLVQFFKYLDENYENLNFQEASKVVIVGPPNSYILHFCPIHIQPFTNDSNSENNNL